MAHAVETQPTPALPEPIEAVEATAFRKAMWRMLPILTTAYVFNFLDRTNIGFASLQMNRDLGLSPAQFGLGAGILFIGYCCFEIPSNMLLYRFGARRWISRILISWGVVSCAMALVVGPKSFYTLRLVLGIAEAGFFPGIAYFLSAWFPQESRSRILAWFLVAIPVSSVIGGPIGGLLMQWDGLAGLAGWQWLFLIEGAPSVVIGLLLLRVITDRPQDAHWLTEAEKHAVVSRLRRESQRQAVKRFGPALKDVRVWICTIIYLGFTIGSYGIQIWLPQILKEQDLTTLQIGWISAVPFALASIAMIVWATRADKGNARILNLALCCALGAAGLLLAIARNDFVPSLVGITIALVGVTSARAIFWAIPAQFLTGIAAAGGIALINTIGTSGGFFGPIIVGGIKSATGSFEAGLLAMAGFLAMSTIAAVWLRRVSTDAHR